MREFDEEVDMSRSWPPIRLRELPVNLKVLVTFFIIALGLGYLVAYLHLYLHFEMADGKPGMTMADVKAHFKDGKGPSRLERGILGRMGKYFVDEAEKKKTLKWVRKGGPQASYPNVAPIIDMNCVVCHRKGPNMRFPPLETFDEARLACRPEGTPPTAYELSGTTHTHLTALAALIAAVGVVFAFTGVRPWLGAIIVLAAFLGLLADIAGWWLATRYDWGALVSVVGGSVMGTALLIQMFWSLAATWFGRKSPNA